MDIGENFHVEFADDQAYVFEVTGRERTQHDSSSINFSDWTKTPISLEDWEVIPFGPDNDLPLEIQETVFSNHLAPRILTGKQSMLYGQSPMLYEMKVEGERLIRTPVENPQIQEWLDSIDYINTLLVGSNDYYYTEGVFYKVFTDRGARIGSGNGIADVKPMSNAECRLCFKKGSKDKKPTHVMVGDWSDGKTKEFAIYPLFDPKNQGLYPTTIAYSNLPSFGVKHYTIPDIFGGLEWIRRSSAVPYIIKALTNNSLFIKWHIKSPAEYWEAKKKILEDNAKKEKRTYKHQELEDLKKSILQKLTEVLSGVDNVGKFWHSETVIKVMGATQTQHKWEIEPIKQEVKDYVLAQLKIAVHSDFATVAALGFHSALANVGADGKSDSGSEQKYAYQVHNKKDTAIPEMIICQTFNQIIKVKFGTTIKLGFYREPIAADEDTTPSQRFVNQ